MSLNGHAQRVADQHHIDAFVGEQFGKAVVVGGNGGEAFLFLLVFLQQGDGGWFHHNPCWS